MFYQSNYSPEPVQTAESRLADALEYIKRTNIDWFDGNPETFVQREQVLREAMITARQCAATPEITLASIHAAEIANSLEEMADTIKNASLEEDTTAELPKFNIHAA